MLHLLKPIFIYKETAASYVGPRTPYIAIEIGPSVGHASLPLVRVRNREELLYPF